jgi:hypothetical protein
MRDEADRAMFLQVMVCDTCGAPAPDYWFLSNAAGENLGGIFCSKGCAEIARLSGAEGAPFSNEVEEKGAPGAR